MIWMDEGGDREKVRALVGREMNYVRWPICPAYLRSHEMAGRAATQNKNKPMKLFTHRWQRMLQACPFHCIHWPTELITHSAYPFVGYSP